MNKTAFIDFKQFFARFEFHTEDSFEINVLFIENIVPLAVLTGFILAKPHSPHPMGTNKYIYQQSRIVHGVAANNYSES